MSEVRMYYSDGKGNWLEMPEDWHSAIELVTELKAENERLRTELAGVRETMEQAHEVLPDKLRLRIRLTDGRELDVAQSLFRVGYGDIPPFLEVMVWEPKQKQEPEGQP